MDKFTQRVLKNYSKLKQPHPIKLTFTHLPITLMLCLITSSCCKTRQDCQFSPQAQPFFFFHFYQFYVLVVQFLSSKSVSWINLSILLCFLFPFRSNKRAQAQQNRKFFFSNFFHRNSEPLVCYIYCRRLPNTVVFNLQHYSISISRYSSIKSLLPCNSYLHQ